jgi:hypothetical protein
MKPSDYLKKGWCQGVLAKDAKGRNAGLFHSPPVAWCITGAMNASFKELSKRARFYKLCQKLINYDVVSTWNDTTGRTQAEVIALAEEVEKRMGL